MILSSVLSSSLGVGFIFGFQPPLIALLLNRAGFSSATVGAVTGASLLAVIVLGPLYPVAIATLGLKRSIVGGIGGAALILVTMPFLPSVTAWICLRVLTGCVLGLSWIASEIWLNSAGGEQSRGTVMGIYGTAFSIGTIAGPVVLEFTGTEGWLPFAAGAACLAVTLLPLIWLPNEKSASQGVMGARAFLRACRKAPIVLTAALVAGLVESADLALLPLLGLRAGFGERAALLLLTVFIAGNVALQVPIGILADRFGRRSLLGVCALSSAIGPLLLQPALAKPILLWPLLFLWGGTLYAFYSQGVALLGEEFDAAELPTANTSFVMVYCLGGVLGPSVGGLAMEQFPRFGLPALLSGAAVSLLAALAFADRKPGPIPRTI